MVYVVMFFEEYEGSAVDEYSKAFKNKRMAHEYANKLNVDYAKANGCRIKDLGDYYIVVAVPFVEK